MNRRAEIAAGLSDVRQRIATACARAGRDAAEVGMIVVTKTFPASDVRLLAELGVTDVGENRHQEAVDKHAECADLPLRWHFVGALQTNKAAAVAEYADFVHSVDRPRLVQALDKATHQSGRLLQVLVQVNLDDDAVASGGARAGARPGEVSALADELTGHPLLRLAGVMGVAPLGGHPDAAFSRLAAVSAELKARHPDAVMVSAGMSADLEAALECGATHVRVGSSVLGARPPSR